MEDLYLLKVNRETIADESYLSNKFWSHQKTKLIGKNVSMYGLLLMHAITYPLNKDKLSDDVIRIEMKATYFSYLKV